MEDNIICQIMDMGFEDIEEIKSALVLANEDVVEAVSILTNKQDTMSTGKPNLNTKFDFGTGDMKPLKQLILEACITTLNEEIEKLHRTRTVNIQWTTKFGVELIWRDYGGYLEQLGYVDDNVKKNIDRLINQCKKKPLTGMGDIDDTASDMRPSREEDDNDNMADACTVELVQNVLELRGILEKDYKAVKEATKKKINQNNLSTSSFDEEGDDKNGDRKRKKDVVGMIMNKKKAGEARRDATHALGQPERVPKPAKTSNSEDNFDETMRSLSKLAEERAQREQERMQFEAEEREYRRQEREEAKKEREEAKKERKEKEKEKEEKLKEDLQKSIEEKFEQLKADQERRNDDLKKYLADLIRK